MRRLLSIAAAGLWLAAPAAFAQLPGLISQPMAGGGQSWSLPVQTLVFITSLTFLQAKHDDDAGKTGHHRVWPAA